MKIELRYDSCYMQKLSLLMKAIRKEEGKASDFWKESLYEPTVVHFAHGLPYPEWVVCTERSYISIRNEMIGRSFSETFDVSERQDFDPGDSFWDDKLDEFVFVGSFIGACRFILNVSLRKWREFGVHVK